MKVDPLDPAVVSAIRIVGPPARLRDAFSEDVVSAMHSIGEADVQRGWTMLRKSKEGKLAAQSLGRALRHVVNLWTDKNTEFPPELTPNHFTLNKLVALAERCELMVESPSGVLPRRAAEAKRDAVHHAYRLMTKYDVPAKGSKFHKFAELLLNDSEADLTPLCKAHKRALNKGEKRGTK